MLQKTYLKTKDYCKVKFTFQDGAAQKVEILGLNSDWETPIEMSKRKDGSFCTEISLPKNTQHEFKYRVNSSEWVNEPEADAEHENGFGSKNSVLVL